jgi:hypothetical protein
MFHFCPSSISVPMYIYAVNSWDLLRRLRTSKAKFISQDASIEVIVIGMVSHVAISVLKFHHLVYIYACRFLYLIAGGSSFYSKSSCSIRLSRLSNSSCRRDETTIMSWTMSSTTQYLVKSYCQRRKTRVVHSKETELDWRHCLVAQGVLSL